MPTPELPRGLWVDKNGDPHFSIPDVLAEMGLPHTLENVAACREALEETIRSVRPDVQIVQRTLADLPDGDPRKDPLRPGKEERR